MHTLCSRCLEMEESQYVDKETGVCTTCQEEEIKEGVLLKHDTNNGGDCWCEPEYFDGVWIHKETNN